MKSTLVLSTFLFFLLAGCGTTSNNGGVSRTTVVNPPPAGTAMPDSLTVIPGPEYAAGWLHTALFGDHYRDIWTSPTKVKVLDLGTFANGLTPLKQGGGFQTKSLRLQGADGKLYAFRSVNKDPKKVLPPELQDTFAADVIQDQISSSNPSAPMVVDVLADALGILHPKPAFVLMPDDARLGEYRDTFAGLLGIIEEYPAAGAGGFGGSDKIVSTIKLFETLEKSNENRVNAEAMLTARLLDVFVGDWDRHIDQWRWARFKEKGHNLWYPIPRDRDQAFALFDGLFARIAAAAITQFEHFDDHFRHVPSLIFSGRYVDRRLLVSLDRQQWDAVVQSVIARLTDEVIEQAVKTLPEEHYALRGAWLIKALKSRRNVFQQAADEYYDLLSDYVDIHLSDEPEFVEVKRIDDERVEVIAHATGTAGAPDDVIFHRTFLREETNEIRLYLHGGNDSCVVNGDVGSSILVRVIGGGGSDYLVDQSYVHGWLWGFVPFILQAKRCTYFYDDKGKNTFFRGPSCVVDQSDYQPPPPGLTQY
jgi:hypothetical protein